ncbi:MAG: Cof-type HAD-IIB family hydrolase [Eubacterium sp.]|nr:Cof-type HAD-IIB family hydrolase [Eubacterium sp.]
MSEKYRILFSDLDATLLNDNKEIEAGALDAIDALLSQGDFFAICTGRPLASARAVACKAGLERSGCYIVSYNGGVIYDPSRDQIVSYASIPLSVVRRLFEKAQQAGLYIHTYDRTSDTVLTIRHTKELDAYIAHTRLRPKTGAGVLEQMTEEPAKMIVISEDHKRLEQFQKENEAWSGDVLNSFFSCEPYLEYCPAGISKGSAVRALCAYLNLPVAASVAAGDERNDIAMLQAAGIGAAPRNAHPLAKEAADYVCEKDHNEGAVGEIIRRFFIDARSSGETKVS